MGEEAIAWLNLACLHLSSFLMLLTYILSLTPASREEVVGERAWREATWYRSASNVLELVMIANVALWIWFPVPPLDRKVHPSPWVGIAAGAVMAIPLAWVDLRANLDLGAEGFGPSKDTPLAGGIYRYIRHPQMIGEIPLFIAGALCINSAFLALWFLAYVCIYIPVLMHFEEPDLTKRFGRPYEEYRRRTGAIFPRLR
jgi:protein-S-isoprenylcysteine O-methyltransferase Ste14